MGLLANVRQCTAEFHWGLAGKFFQHKVLDAIQVACSEGRDQVFIPVDSGTQEMGSAAIKALSLEGFSSCWEDESRRRIHVSWSVRFSR